MKEGYIKVYRAITENHLWLSEPFTRAQAWVDLLLSANHKEGALVVRGNVVRVSRGQVGHSVKTLADRWGWSRGKAQRFLNHLETEQQIEQQKNNVTTLITITNFERYQGSGHQNKQQTDSRRTADGQQTDTNKNEKNEKNTPPIVPPDKKTKKFTPPSIEDVEAYCRERGNDVDPPRWHDHYSAKGWMIGKNRMKDWRAAVRTWEKESKQRPKKKERNDWAAF